MHIDRKRARMLAEELKMVTATNMAIARAEDLPVWIQHAVASRVLEVECQVSDHATVEKRKTPLY